MRDPDDLPPPTPAPPTAWWALLALVLLGQAALAWEVVVGPGGWRDARPAVTGRHPLHLYHAGLGAATFRERSGTACYDPAFQAGYPKTPVFDGGCRPAEIALLLAGPDAPPAAAYRRGLWALAALVPLTFAAAARAAGASPAGGVVAAALGALFWWTPPVRHLFDEGDCEHLLAGLMGVAALGGLARYGREPGLFGWFLLAGAAALGWCAHPVVWLALAPLFAGYYFVCAPRHGPGWHLGLLGATLAGLLPNLWWLWDWCRFWWLRQPSLDEMTPPPAWGHFLGEPADWAGLVGDSPVAWGLLALGLPGVFALARGGRGLAAGLFLAAALGAFGVARLGATWATLTDIGAGRAAPLALAALVVPAAALLDRLWRDAKARPLAVGLLALAPAALAWGGPAAGVGREALGLDLRPLAVGLTAGQRELVAGLRTLTTADARVLLEEPSGRPAGWNWTALLPDLTGRHFLGGLDPDACVEHSFCGLRDGRFNGRAFADWTPGERDDAARRLNVGWVLCRTREAEAFWRAFPGCREVGRFDDGGEAVLLALGREPSFVLKGRATVERLDRRGVVLSDVVPDGGEVLLSLHHQPGFRSAPSLVLVGADRDAHDPIPMLRLTLPGPVSRLALSWENR